jgi:hypothetical protein
VITSISPVRSAMSRIARPTSSTISRSGRAFIAERRMSNRALTPSSELPARLAARFSHSARASGRAFSATRSSVRTASIVSPARSDTRASSAYELPVPGTASKQATACRSAKVSAPRFSSWRAAR